MVNVNRRALIGAAASAALLSSIPQSALAFGQRPITIVVPWPAGGPLDVSARILADAVKGDLGTVIVENRPGAGGTRGVSCRMAARSSSAPSRPTRSTPRSSVTFLMTR